MLPLLESRIHSRWVVERGNGLDALDRQILDRLQRAFPLVPEPFETLAQGLRIEPEEVLRRIASLKEMKLVRQISAIFNTGALGYRTSLVAMAVSDEKLEHASKVVNRYPGVSHNYLRPGRYNMWYTIAVPPGHCLQETVSGVALEAGGWPTLILPALKKYKLAVVLDVLDEGEADSCQEEAAPSLVTPSVHFVPTSENTALVKCLQEDLPLEERPFEALARGLGMTQERLLAVIADWTETGVIRRFAAVLNHRKVGFSANGMVVWNCPLDQIDERGLILGSQPEVTHCYHRPASPEWPFNLYAMVHGRSRDECEVIAGRLGALIGDEDYSILFSTREFKKIRLKLFWD